MTAQPSQLGAQGLRIVGRYDKPGDTVLYYLGHTAHICANRWCATGHAFQQRLPEQLRDVAALAVHRPVHTGEDHTQCLAIRADQVRVGEIVMESDLFSRRQRTQVLIESRVAQLRSEERRVGKECRSRW